LYATNLILGVLDLLFCGCTTYTNPLRPLAGVLRARRGRKFFDILKKMLPEMLDNLIPVLFFVVIVMGAASILFDIHVSEFRSSAYMFYNWLFLVLTNDTFDRLLPETLFINLSYLLFFFPAIYVGQRFLFNLIIGDTYETFRSYVKKQLKKEKLKELFNFFNTYILWFGMGVATIFALDLANAPRYNPLLTLVTRPVPEPK
jgi:hypothetical protein